MSRRMQRRRKIALYTHARRGFFRGAPSRVRACVQHLHAFHAAYVRRHYPRESYTKFLRNGASLIQINKWSTSINLFPIFRQRPKIIPFSVINFNINPISPIKMREKN